MELVSTYNKALITVAFAKYKLLMFVIKYARSMLSYPWNFFVCPSVNSFCLPQLLILNFKNLRLNDQNLSLNDQNLRLDEWPSAIFHNPNRRRKTQMPNKLIPVELICHMFLEMT